MNGSDYEELLHRVRSGTTTSTDADLLLAMRREAASSSERIIRMWQDTNRSLVAVKMANCKLRSRCAENARLLHREWYYRGMINRLRAERDQACDAVIIITVLGAVALALLILKGVLS